MDKAFCLKILEVSSISPQNLKIGTILKIKKKNNSKNTFYWNEHFQAEDTTLLE